MDTVLLANFTCLRPYAYTKDCEGLHCRLCRLHCFSYLAQINDALMYAYHLFKLIKPHVSTEEHIKPSEPQDLAFMLLEGRPTL